MLLVVPDDAYLPHVKLLWLGARTGWKGVAAHFRHVVASADNVEASAQ
jgi:hypothetical protein